MIMMIIIGPHTSNRGVVVAVAFVVNLVVVVAAAVVAAKQPQIGTAWQIKNFSVNDNIFRQSWGLFFRERESY